MDSLLADLMQAGFTEYESRVYLALLGENPTTGYQLSKKAGIPRSMVYEALGRLNARGAVLSTDDGRSTLYRPVPPDVLLDRYEQEQRKLVHNLRENLQHRYHSSSQDHLWTISGRGAVQAYALQMIQGAQAELLLVLPDPDLIALEEKLVAAGRRLENISVLLTGQASLDLPAGQVVRHPPFESQLQHLDQLLVMVADQRECLVASPGPAGFTATLTNNPNLVFIVRQFIWMELFSQRMLSQLGSDLLSRLAPQDRRIFENWPQE